MIKKRLKAFMIDYIVISVYLGILLGISILRNPDVFDSGLGESHWNTQLISLISSVLPVVIVFSVFEARIGQTLGKRLAHIQVSFENKKYSRSLVRNAMKFLPWQLGHMATIHALYYGTDVVFIFLTIINSILVTTYITGLLWKIPYLPDYISKARTHPIST